jgi:dolichol-phosphate mannosyltransferase
MIDSNQITGGYELAMVMPVYNEEACVVSVITSWLKVLSDLEINFILLVLNDGSTDNTSKELNYFKEYHQVKIINKANSGHGPSILMGYKEASHLAEWIFQCDSDNEMEARYFPQLWTQRKRADALFGIRTGRQQNLQRKIITLTSRLLVRTLFGKTIVDVNVPYRLIRSEILSPVLQKIPSETFAPNIIISGALSKYSILNIPIPIQPRQTGVVSIMKWRLWRAAILAFWQIVRISRTI